MEKKLKVTKENLQKENTLLSAKVQRLEAADERIRRVFSELLDSYDYYQGVFSKNKAVVVQSWEGIAFLMGELKSDADYSCVLSARDNFRDEAESLRQRIKDLENTPKNI